MILASKYGIIVAIGERLLFMGKKTMLVLVTGGTRYIGNHVCVSLLNAEKCNSAQF